MRLNYFSKSFFCLMLSLVFSFSATAQVKEFAEGLFDSKKTTEEVKQSSVDSTRRADSLKLADLQQQVEQMRLNEALMQMELEATKMSSIVSDSLKRVRQRQMIDSLRKTTKGMPLVVDGDTLLRLYLKRSGMSLPDRIDRASEKIVELGENRKVKPDSTHLSNADGMTEIAYEDQVILAITDNDALWENMNRDSMAMMYRDIIVKKIHDLQEKNSILEFMKKVALFLLVILFQYVLFFFTTKLFRKTKGLIIRLSHSKFKSISIRDYEILNTTRQARILIFFSNIVRYILVALQLIISVPMLFSIFPQTKDLANRIFDYILSPVKAVVMSVINYIPNLFTIIVICFCMRYVIKGLQYLAKEIETERLKITGFYADWAQPTYNIIRFLLYAFMLVLIYPHLPGANSVVFQGVSVFVGLIVSMGSSSVIGNVIAGLVITYMRPFKMGDRIKLNDTVGNVIEKTPFVTRIKTPKNEVVTIPNSFVLSSHSVNYSSSARNYGLILHTDVTVNYDEPWQKIHKLLIEAAKETEGVSKFPEPFVLETNLHDFYGVYQINAYISDADKMSQIYSNLHQSIQDKLIAAGVDIESPVLYRQRLDDLEGEISPMAYRKKKHID